MSKKELTEELYKPIIRKFEEIKVQLTFMGNIWSAHLAYIQLRSKLNKVFRFLFCAIDIYDKSAWVFPLKDKKEITITNHNKKL